MTSAVSFRSVQPPGIDTLDLAKNSSMRRTPMLYPLIHCSFSAKGREKERCKKNEIKDEERNDRHGSRGIENEAEARKEEKLGI